MITRVVLDVCVWSQEWFKDVLNEITKNDDIVFVYSSCGKYSEELDRLRQLQDFLRIQMALGRCEIAPVKDILHYERYLSNQKDFCSCEQCDDPHIFSLIRVKGVKFVFTSDVRMGKCKKKMQNILAREFLSFKIIASRKQYTQRRAELGL